MPRSAAPSDGADVRRPRLLRDVNLELFAACVLVVAGGLAVAETLVRWVAGLL